MPLYPINKGVGKSVEVKGLRAQYVIYAVLGTVLSFLVFFVCSFFLNQWISLLLSTAILCFNVILTVWLNNRFGEKGLVQVFATISLPDRIANIRRIHSFLKVSNENKIKGH